MKQIQALDDYLQSQAADDYVLTAVAETILCISAAAKKIARLVAANAQVSEQSPVCPAASTGDVQTDIDLVAHDYIIDALKDAPVGSTVSEELAQPHLMKKDGPLFVAIDPLDGSSNNATNVAVGTIFSVLPAIGGQYALLDDVVLQPGVNQLAAGYFIYGPSILLVLTVGEGTHVFKLDPEDDKFYLTSAHVQIAETMREIAIDLSTFRHWDEFVRSYIDDRLESGDGLRRSSYNMRWISSLVAECHRILSTGGIALYSGDDRKGHSEGRLRLLYACNPIAFLVEQAGGGATTGEQRILEIPPSRIHQRVPMFLGSSHEIRRIERFCSKLHVDGGRSQLTNKRGLIRA